MTTFTLTYEEAKFIEIIAKDTCDHDMRDSDFTLFDKEKEKRYGWNFYRSSGTLKIKIPPYSTYLTFYDTKIVGDALELSYGSNAEKKIQIPIQPDIAVGFI